MEDSAMAPPQSNLSRPLGISPTKTGKHVRIEDDPEDQILMGRCPHESPGSRVQTPGGNQHGYRLGDEDQCVYQSKEDMDHVYSQDKSHQVQQTAQYQKHGQKLEQSHQKSGQPETHEQSSAPRVGATPQTPGVYLHTSINPTMSVGLGYAHGYPVLPTQPSAPVNNILHQPFLQDLNPGVNPFNTTYIGARNMTYYRNTHSQQGSRYDPLALHFQPPVPDTTYGPMTHIYVPGQDPPGLHAPADGPVQVRHFTFNVQSQGPVAKPPTHALMVVQPATVQVPPCCSPGFCAELADQCKLIASRDPMMGVCYEFAGAKFASRVPLQPQAGISATPTLMVHHQLTIPAVHLQHSGPEIQYPGQSAMIGGQIMPGAYPSQPAQNPIICAPAPVTAVPGIGLPMAPFPTDTTGASKTMTDIQAHHHEITMANPNLEPEDFQPASTYPSKMYYCRELDGNWTLRTRYAIDKMGEWRWYQTPEGAFYAVRLPN
ncbi:uncharacterized protein DNG_05457 [Cephalotrichum gorgonifer]|uniref:Uncharacterized protein n=1 Tax=Cephalotrichum gorgonifer TaxID=2041049 RepID=A0AAE8MYE3_9PEZI|nr:uncharacterized protein DNG_05457 [Cephalotrichum gorgonifer]